MNKNMLLTVLLVVLVAVAVVQAFQLSGLKEKVSGGNVNVAANSGTPVSSSSGQSDKLKQNLQNLPTMVGGC